MPLGINSAKSHYTGLPRHMQPQSFSRCKPVLLSLQAAEFEVQSLLLSQQAAKYVCVCSPYHQGWDAQSPDPDPGQHWGPGGL